MFAKYSSCDACNVEVKDYLKEEITGTYSEYTDDQVKCKLAMEGPKAEVPWCCIVLFSCVYV